jgi:diadenosine tetraphosphate (Ap4A) HIT family hydrolase
VSGLENSYSHLTAKKRDRPSFPTRKLLGLGHVQGRVLDYGCGYGTDVDFLRSKGFEVEAYDPHHAPGLPEGTFDTILCHYVLNVLLRREQTEVLMGVSELLRPSGTAFYTVRRDLQRTGFRHHYKHDVPTYQTNVRLPFETVVRTEFCEIYRYQPYPERSFEDGSACSACSPSAEQTLVTESAQAYSIIAPNPVTDGHTIVFPKRHVPSYFDLAEPERKACWVLTDRVHSILHDRHDPDGLNIGINDGTAAGQVIDHTHIHILPRYDEGDDDTADGVQKILT